MNIYVVVATSLLCGAVGLNVAARKRAAKRRTIAMRRIAEKTRSVLLRHRNMTLGLSAILCLSFICLPAHAQEIIHARAGQVVASDQTAKTLTLKTADGFTVLYHDVTDPEPAILFNKEVRSETVPAGSFHKLGAHVVVFYFGLDRLTAVAVKELGPDDPKRSTGSIASFDRHQHLLTVKTDSAEPQKLVLSNETVLDTPSGIVRLADFHPSKGEPLRCFTRPQSQAALFVALNY